MAACTSSNGRRQWSLQRRGVQQDTLKTGDRIVVSGNPHREFEQNRILNFKSVRRLSDGWKWPNW